MWAFTWTVNAPDKKTKDGFRMTVSKVFEYLVRQSLQGNHLLFDPENIRRALDPKGLLPLSESEAISIEQHIERLVDSSTLERKRAYLESLDPKTHAWVIKAYFNLIETNLHESQGVLH
jgi:hypothetical protein